MDSAKESLDLAYQISQILGTGLDRHTLSLLIALCDRGVNPEALSALVRELSSSSPSDPPPPPTTTTSAGGGVGGKIGNSFSGNGSAPFAPSSTTSSFRSNLNSLFSESAPGPKIRGEGKGGEVNFYGLLAPGDSSEGRKRFSGLRCSFLVAIFFPSQIGV